MNRLLLPLFAVLTFIVGAICFVLLRTDTVAATSDASTDTELRTQIDRVSQQVQELERKLERLERSRDGELSAQRAPAAAPSARAVEPPERAAPDARWYLDQYVRSFNDDEKGSELYRLHVDARATELIFPICDLVRESRRPVALRVALVAMIGRTRFRSHSAIADTLLGVLRANGPENLASAAIDAIAIVGGAALLPALEDAVFVVTSVSVRSKAIQVVIHIAGEQSNAAIMRLLARTSDDALACELIALLNNVDLESALHALRSASTRNQPVRLCDAQKIGKYSAQQFRLLVAEWLAVETDGQVIEALKQAAQLQQTEPGWSPAQAVGPPDVADPGQDSENAWASLQADMGAQWLELRYAAPMPAYAVHIFEANVPGAVSELLTLNQNGSWVSLWSGTASSANRRPLVIEFVTTTVQTLRVVLDTNRAPDWNEIDAVELVGPNGRQWAANASASSSYAYR